MEEKEWKLGKDMFLDDNMFDPITFDEVVLAVRCNCRDINCESVRKTAMEIFDMKKEDFLFILYNNIGEIIKEVKKQKGIIEETELIHKKGIEE